MYIIRWHYAYGVAVAPKSKGFPAGTVAAPMVSVAKLVDAADCGSAGRNPVGVQVSSFTLTLQFLWQCQTLVSQVEGQDRGLGTSG